MEKEVIITYKTNTQSLKKANDDINNHQTNLKRTQEQLHQLEKQGKSTSEKILGSAGLVQNAYNTVKDLGTPGNLFDKKFNELRALLKGSGVSAENFLHNLQGETNFEISRVDLLQKAIVLRKKGISLDTIPKIIASNEEAASNSTKEIDQLDSSWNNLLSSFGGVSTVVIKATTLGLLVGRKVVEAVKFGLTHDFRTANKNEVEINDNIMSVFWGHNRQPMASFPKMMPAHGNTTLQPSLAPLSSPKPTPQPHKPTTSELAYSHALTNDGLQKLPVKTAGDVASQISVAFKAPMLATVNLKKGLQETAAQSKKTFASMTADALKAGLGIGTLSDAAALVGRTIAQSIESGVGAFKAVLKNILTILLDFLEKELLEAEAAATLRTIFGDFGAFAQLAAGVAAIEIAKVAVNSFALGGWINEPVIGRGLRSGELYTLGERGPEYVMPNSQLNQIAFEARVGQRFSEQYQPVFIVRNEINSAGLATFVEKGNRILRRRNL